MNHLWRAWCWFWFLPTSRHGLWLVRYGVAIGCLLKIQSYANIMISRAASPGADVYDWTLGSRLVPLPYPIGGSAGEAIHLVLSVAAILAAVGLLTRVNLFITGAGLIYLASGSASSGNFDHEVILPMQAAIILSLCPGATSGSIDRLISLWRRGKLKRATRSRRRLLARWRGPAQPRWGLQLILVLIAAIYFTAGVSKVRYSGGQWYDGQTLAYYMDGTHQAEFDRGQVLFADPSLPDEAKFRDGVGLVDHAYGTYARRPALWLSSIPGMMPLLAVMTLVLELSSPVLLLGPWWRNLYLASAIGMHTGIWLTMALPFNSYRLMALSLIAWRPVVRLCQRILNGRNQAKAA